MYKQQLCYFIITLTAVWAFSHSKEEQNIQTYQRCHYDTDCKENSFCYENDDNRLGMCKCKDGYELLSRNKTYYMCSKTSQAGEDCIEDAQCQYNMGGLAKCDTICKCREGAHLYSDGQCYKSIKLNDVCRTDANCLLKTGKVAYCVDGYCNCNINQRPTEDRLDCFVAKNLGDLCANNQDCSNITNAACSNVCKCLAGYIMTRSQLNCIKAATAFGDPCIENDQCSKYLTNGICKNEHCSCPEGQHHYGGKCARSVRKGQICISTEECVFDERLIKTVVCNEGVCECIEGVTDEYYGCSSASFNYCSFLVNLLALITCTIVLKNIF